MEETETKVPRKNGFNRLTIQIPKKVAESSRIAAEKRRVSFSAYCRMALDNENQGRNLPLREDQELLFAHFEDLGRVISKLNATATNNAVSREELIEALMIIAKLKPEFEANVSEFKESTEQSRRDIAGISHDLKTSLQTTLGSIAKSTTSLHEAVLATIKGLDRVQELSRNIQDSHADLSHFRQNLKTIYEQQVRGAWWFVARFYLFGIGFVSLVLVALYGFIRLTGR